MSLVTKLKLWPTVLQVSGLAIVVLAVIFAPPLVRTVAVAGCAIAGVGYAWRTLEK